MSTLWERDEHSVWTPRRLEGEAVELGESRPREENASSTARSGRIGKVLLLPLKNGCNSRDWLLLWKTDTRININGIPLSSGIRCLAEKDEITIDSSHTVYFTREEPAQAKKFPGSDRKITCAFCHRPIEDGHFVVECPGCGYLFHQMEARECYTYDSTCRHCNTPTELGAGPLWTPEEL